MNIAPTYSILTHNAIKEPSQKMKPKHTYHPIIPAYILQSKQWGITKKEPIVLRSFHHPSLHQNPHSPSRKQGKHQNRQYRRPRLIPRGNFTLKLGQTIIIVATAQARIALTSTARIPTIRRRYPLGIQH